MITHFLNPENTEFTACGIWSFVDSVDEIKTSSDVEGITCKNCIKTKSYILNCISKTRDKIKSYSNLHTPTPRKINA